MFKIGDSVKVKDSYLSIYKEYRGKKRKVIRKSVASNKTNGEEKYLYVLDDTGIKDSIPFFEYEIEKAN